MLILCPAGYQWRKARQFGLPIDSFGPLNWQRTKSSSKILIDDARVMVRGRSAGGEQRNKNPCVTSSNLVLATWLTDTFTVTKMRLLRLYLIHFPLDRPLGNCWISSISLWAKWKGIEKNGSCVLERHHHDVDSPPIHGLSTCMLSSPSKGIYYPAFFQRHLYMHIHMNSSDMTPLLHVT